MLSLFTFTLGGLAKAGDAFDKRTLKSVQEIPAVSQTDPPYLLVSTAQAFSAGLSPAGV
jgi:hypothetical protein